MRFSMLLALSIFLAACNNTKVSLVPTKKTEPTADPATEPYEAVKIAKNKVQFPAVKITPDNTWFNKLIPNGERNTAMVNASNEQATFYGGGINGAMVAYFKANGLTSWGQLYNPSGIAHRGEVRPGHFIYSHHIKPIAFDYQLHAVGPRKREYVDNFASAREAIKDLTFDMLEWVLAKNIDNIVIPAISTQIFADDDELYRRQMYNGMVDGVLKFIEKNGNETRPKNIYLNLWDMDGNPGVNRLRKQTEG